MLVKEKAGWEVVNYRGKFKMVQGVLQDVKCSLIFLGNHIFIVFGGRVRGNPSRKKTGYPSQNKRGSIDHSLCFSTGLLELLEILQDDVI